MTLNEHAGITRSSPQEDDWIFGYQRMFQEPIKWVFEYRHHQFDDLATGAFIPALGAATHPARLTDDGFTLRVMFGF